MGSATQSYPRGQHLKGPRGQSQTHAPVHPTKTSPAEPERVLFLLPAFAFVAGTGIPAEAGAGTGGFWHGRGTAELSMSKAQSLRPASLNGNFADGMTVGVGSQGGRQVQTATGCGITSTLHY